LLFLSDIPPTAKYILQKTEFRLLREFKKWKLRNVGRLRLTGGARPTFVTVIHLVCLLEAFSLGG
jgi:hypothetical protein